MFQKSTWNHRNKKKKLCVTDRNTFLSIMKIKVWPQNWEFKAFGCLNALAMLIPQYSKRHSNLQRSNLLLHTQMMLISYPCFFISITAHPIWKISFSQKWLDHQQRKCYSIREVIRQFLKRAGQRCPIYCLLMLSLIVIWLLPIQPSTYPVRLSF